MKGYPTVGNKVNIPECIELYNSGLSMCAVGKLTGHPHGVIKYHLIRNGIKVRSYGETRRLSIPPKKIAEMYGSGMSATEVAKELGITYQCVYDRLSEVGIKTRSRQDQIKMMIKRGTYNIKSGANHKNWNGGKRTDSNGYVYVMIAPHTYIPEHRYIWEKHNGAISSGYIVHHLNGDKLDNRIENLVAMPRKHHSPKAIIDPYKKRIRELEAEIIELKKRV